MSSAENRKEVAKKVELEDLGPGVRGRSIPREERELSDDQVRKLAEQTGSEAFADFIFSLYKVKPRKTEK